MSRVFYINPDGSKELLYIEVEEGLSKEELAKLVEAAQEKLNAEKLS